MKKNTPFIKGVAFALSMVVFRASLVWAAPVMPGKLAVLEPPLPLPEMRAAWDSIRNAIYLDPLILVRGREEVRKVLDDWHVEAKSVLSARESADRIALDRVEKVLAKAWGLYYRFDFSSAARILEEGEKSLGTPGDSGFRAHLLFEIQILKGVVSRAAGEKGYVGAFEKAAALDPSRELPPERYSPEIISVYGAVRREFLAGKPIPVSMAGTPADAEIRVDGREKGGFEYPSEIEVFPGKHFIEVLAPGYEPQSLVVDTRESGPVNVRWELIPLGPEDGPDGFFLERLQAGDRAFMMLLASRLKVDYLLVPDPHESVLNAWLLDREGRSVNRTVLWKEGDSTRAGCLKAAGLLVPIRQQWAFDRRNGIGPMNMPAPDAGLPGDIGSHETSANWKKYALALGLILLVGAAAGGDSSSTRVEAAW